MERVNVNLPRPLLDDLRRLVPRSRRSEVIARATARELRRLKLAATLDAMLRQPAWTDERYPTLADGPTIDSSLGRLRGGGAAALNTRRRRRTARE